MDCDLEAKWILEFDDKFMPLCQGHFEDWCRMEGEMYLDFWLIANLDFDMISFLKYVNNTMNQKNLQLKWARDEIRKLKNNS